MRVPGRPCENCPWRRDVEPGEFAASRYEALRSTAPGPNGESVGLGQPMFACHKSKDGQEHVCAGWLAVCGRDHIRVRLAVVSGDVPVEALAPKPDWPALYDDYEEMADAMGDPFR